MQTFISKLSDKEKKVFYIAVFAVSLFLLDLLFLRPVFSKLSKLDGEIAQEEILIQNDLNFLQYKDRITGEAEILRPFTSAEGKAQDEIYTEFFGEIEQLARQAGVDLVKSNPADVETNEDYTNYFADIDTNGTLDNLTAFIHAINTSDDLFKVVRFNLGPRRGSEEEYSVAMTVSRMVVQPY